MTSTDTDTVRPNFRFIGVTDDCVDCQRVGCPKTGLKHTIVLMPLDEEGNDEGEVTYYGSSCAALVLGIRGPRAGARVLDTARAAARRTADEARHARRMLAAYGLPEVGEPTREQIRNAMQLYVRNHRGIADQVQETGIGVRARVLEMLAWQRDALADARALKLPGF